MTPATGDVRAERISILGVRIDPLTMDDAIARLLEWIRQPRYDCRYVVTPNVNHVVRFQTDELLRASYADASLVVVDGKPVLLVSRLLGRALPEVVPGVDLCSALLDAACRELPLRVFLLGAAEGVAQRAAARVMAQWPGVEVCGTYSPPMDFSIASTSSETAVERINAARPDVLVVGLGAPKQEIWVHQVSGRLNVKVAMCLGAAIDYLSGQKSRAPRWMRSAGLEWAYRVMTEPRRLTRRYVHDGLRFPRIVFRELFDGKTERSAGGSAQARVPVQADSSGDGAKAPESPPRSPE